MKSKDEDMRLVGAYLSGQATAEEVARLESRMLADRQLRTDFLACARVDAALPRALSGGSAALSPMSEATPAARWSWRRWVPAAAAAAVLIGVVAGVTWWRENASAAPVVARFGALNECRWVNSETRVRTGDAIRIGQRVELSAGSAEVLFDNGAQLTIGAPAIIEPRTEKSVFLTMGEVSLVAETPESKGFTIVTPVSKFVDIGTAFIARVSPDGLSHLEVAEGGVDVVVEGAADTPRLKAGQALYVEPGDRKIVTRIEPGDGTSAFRFPTIDPPSGEDYADRSRGHATIQVARGELKRSPGNSGPPEVLLDGKGQSRQDAPAQSAFFRNGEGGGFLVDLGREISISRINSYSWHQHDVDDEHRHRATQRYTLYGFSGDDVPDLKRPFREAGWKRIARVNSDRFFEVSEPLERPAQQACSITTASGEIGRYRYLLWVTKGHTFFGELDVFGAPPTNPES